MSDIAALVAARGWVFDVDGCLMRTARPGGAGGEPFPGAVQLVADLKAAGRQIVFCTNASARPPAQYAADLRRLGFEVADDEFVTAGSAAADHVAAHHPGARVLALAADGLTVPMREAGVALVDAADGADADVVVVATTDCYTAHELNAACLAVDRGAALYVTVGTPWFHGGVGKSATISGAVAAAISWVTGVAPQVTGKPSAALAERLLTRFASGSHTSGELVVVGDHPAEIELAHEMGARSVLVLSGAITEQGLADLPAESAPDLTFPDIGTVHDLLTPHLVHPVGARP